MENLLNEYYKLFPNAHFCYEWFDIPQNEQIEILKEAIKDKKDITQTKLFEKYQETDIDIEEKRKCKCCGEYELDKDSLYEVCPICGWESDPVQEENPNIEGGANELSLNQYKQDYFRNIKYLNKANELLNDKSLCLLKYADTKDYILFSYGTKDGKSIFDDCLIKVDKKNQIASYYKIVDHLKEIDKLQFKNIK